MVEFLCSINVLRSYILQTLLSPVDLVNNRRKFLWVYCQVYDTHFNERNFFTLFYNGGFRRNYYF